MLLCTHMYPCVQHYCAPCASSSTPAVSSSATHQPVLDTPHGCTAAGLWGVYDVIAHTLLHRTMAEAHDGWQDSTLAAQLPDPPAMVAETQVAGLPAQLSLQLGIHSSASYAHSTVMQHLHAQHASVS